MVLESLINPRKAMQHPWEMFVIGFIYASVATFLSIWIFKANSSLVMVFLTVMASVPLMYKTMKQEEEADANTNSEKTLLKEHARVIRFLMMMFFGFVVAYSLWFIFLPSQLVQVLFSTQLDTIGAINNQISGRAIDSGNILLAIFINNFKVLLFSIFFSFFYGAGAIFILTWNASVISAAIGLLVKEKIAQLIAASGSIGAFNYFHIITTGILRYAIHGIPEIIAYFVGGLAGGIISVAMINRDLDSPKFKKIMLDALDLFLLAVGILILAALLEVYVTPIFF